jgi:1,4-alpha-glucan branching enzyme
MPGDDWRKYAGARLIYAYQMTHPGKKLTFMGNEIADRKEWRFDKAVNWSLADDPMNAKFQFFVSELNDLYLRSPELWQEDTSWRGFRWIDADDSERSILSFRRIASNKNEFLVVLNFTPEAYEDFVLKVPEASMYKEIFNSDDISYGGSGVTNKNTYFNSTCEGNDNIIRLRLPPLGATILKIVGNNSNR